MYWKKLKKKIIMLLCMLGFLCLMLIRGGKQGEEEPIDNGEILLIPKDGEEADEEPEKEFVFPKDNAKIRVLILADDGSIFHKQKELEQEYPGELIYYEEEEGFVIVNEVPLEEYLCLVVPSEMPFSYAGEALKAQAVCARTYAVWQMQEYAYPEYEAHVDDSTSYQVYNHSGKHETTDNAVSETEGEIMLCGENPVKAYYFSTSCGNTTDENIWEKGDRNQTTYIKGRQVCTSESKKDFTDEETFTTFIKKKHAGDLEISEPWYRWNCYISLEQIQKNVESFAKIRALRTGDGILLKKGDDYIWGVVDTIGEIQKAEIIERNTGGVVSGMLLTGKEGTLKIQYEYNIRLMLGVHEGIVHKNDGTEKSGGELLPSGYFVLEPVEKDGELDGYQVYGGGLGHGAGMSQNGARVLAEQGSSYLEILEYFYQGIHLASLEET